MGPCLRSTVSGNIAGGAVWANLGLPATPGSLHRESGAAVSAEKVPVAWGETKRGPGLARVRSIVDDPRLLSTVDRRHGPILPDWRLVPIAARRARKEPGSATGAGPRSRSRASRRPGLRRHRQPMPQKPSGAGPSSGSAPPSWCCRGSWCWRVPSCRGCLGPRIPRDGICWNMPKEANISTRTWARLSLPACVPLSRSSSCSSPAP